MKVKGIFAGEEADILPADLILLEESFVEGQTRTDPDRMTVAASKVRRNIVRKTQTMIGKAVADQISAHKKGIHSARVTANQLVAVFLS